MIMKNKQIDTDAFDLQEIKRVGQYFFFHRFYFNLLNLGS